MPKKTPVIKPLATKDKAVKPIPVDWETEDAKAFEAIRQTEKRVETSIVSWMNGIKAAAQKADTVSGIIRSVINQPTGFNRVLPFMARVIYAKAGEQSVVNGRLSSLRGLIKQVCEKESTEQLLTVKAVPGEQGEFFVELKDWPKDDTKKLMQKAFKKWSDAPTAEAYDTFMSLTVLYAAEFAEQATSKADELAKQANDDAVNADASADVISEMMNSRKVVEMNQATATAH